MITITRCLKEQLIGAKNENNNSNSFINIFKNLPDEIKRIIAEYAYFAFQFVLNSGKILKMRMKFSECKLKKELERLPALLLKETHLHIKNSKWLFGISKINSYKNRKETVEFIMQILFKNRHAELVMSQFIPCNLKNNLDCFIKSSITIPEGFIKRLFDIISSQLELIKFFK
jgi:hypothetical protein